MGNLRFAVIGHRAPSTGKLSLNDLAGAGGRMDVLVRAVNTALFLSHAMRPDVDVTLHLLGGEGRPRRIWFEGGRLRGVHADERSIAGHIARLLLTPVPPIGRLTEASPGLWHTGGELADTLREWQGEGVTLFKLDAAGNDLERVLADGVPQRFGFILSDDRPFDSAEELLLAEYALPVSVGAEWLQGHSVIAIVHHLLDRI